MYVFVCDNSHTRYLITFIKRQIFHNHFKRKIDKTGQLANGALDGSLESDALSGSSLYYECCACRTQLPLMHALTVWDVITS